MAALDTSIVKALPGLTQSLESAFSGLPSEDTILPPKNGITLLDSKNEIFLSYLQTLALRNLAVIRSVGKHVKNKSGADTPTLDQNLDDQMVKDLVKHRVYLEKGVRPLEERLKYEIDKVVRAADDLARTEQAKNGPAPKKSKKASKTADDDDNEDNSDDESASEIDEQSYRPNIAGLTRAPAATDATASSAGPVMNSAREQAMAEDGIYRPPRITATAMPTTERKEAKERPMRSATIDEYVANELSEAPYAQPSIGSTIVQGGRRDKSARERKEEEERRDYEESNLVRLPKESKKVRAQKAHRERGAFGGEDWRGLTQGVDRIDRLTKKKSGTGGALDRSRKRKADDGQKSDGAGGAEMGRDFEKRKKRAMRSR